MSQAEDHFSVNAPICKSCETCESPDRNALLITSDNAHDLKLRIALIFNVIAFILVRG